MAPLSTLLKEQPAKYSIHKSNETINHLIYMDDLKLIASSQAQLRILIETVKKFSADIKMNFGLDKCAVANFVKGKLDLMSGIEVDPNQTIKSLDPAGHYKYLGIKEGQGLNNPTMKEELRKEYLTRVRKILKSDLGSRNKLTAIGTMAIPVLEYSFGIVDWTIDNIQELDRKTRKLLNMHGMIHPRADIDRLYIPRKNGGRGLRQLEAAYNVAIYRTAHYLNIKGSEDHILNAVKTHEEEKPAQLSIIKKARKIEQKYAEPNTPDNAFNTDPKKLNLLIRKATERNWKNKEMHGQLQRQMEELNADLDMSFDWLRKGDIKGETESLIIAAQDQALRTKSMEVRIHRTSTDSKCRICKEMEETVEHIISGCPILAQNEYIERHNKLCNALHFSLCKHFKCSTKATKWYDHQPESVTTSDDDQVTILYDQPVITDRTVAANKPDLIIRTNRNCYVVDVTIPSDRNIVKKEAEKILKYQSLLIELRRMWGLEVMFIPVVIGARGYVTKELKKYLEKIPGKHSFYELQKTAVLGTAHILRKVLT